jgi:hypothetical protein
MKRGEAGMQQPQACAVKPVKAGTIHALHRCRALTLYRALHACAALSTAAESMIIT